MIKVFRNLTIVFTCVLVVLCASFGVSSLESPVVSYDFENGLNHGFIAPGDLNADGETQAADLILLRTILLNSNSKSYKTIAANFQDGGKFSDVNGDNYVDIVDLVRAKKVFNSTFIGETNGVSNSGAMNIYGKTVLFGKLSKVLEKDRYYSISFKTKSTKPMTISISGISDKTYSYQTAKGNDWKTNTVTFGVAETFKSASQIEVSICGQGIVDDFIITPCVVDNDLADSWS